MPPTNKHQEVAEKIVSLVLESQSRGYSVNKQFILNSVKSILDSAFPVPPNYPAEEVERLKRDSERFQGEFLSDILTLITYIESLQPTHNQSIRELAKRILLFVTPEEDFKRRKRRRKDEMV